MLTKFKAETSSRMAEEKRLAERKKNLLVMIHRHLISCGYLDAATAMERECNIGLDKWELADNIDLTYVLQDYEEYFEMKFLKKPVLTRRNPNAVDDYNGGPRRRQPQGGVLPKINSASQKHLPPSGQKSRMNRQGSRVNQSGHLSVQSSQSKKVPKEEDEGGIGIVGTQVEAKPKPKDENEQIEEFFENRVLKPLPDYSYNPELRDLAMSIQNEVINVNPGVRFNHIVGLDEAKRLLKEAVLMPMKYPHFFQGILEPWKGILLFGPPGTGKTMLAKAVATECRTTFFNISASTIVSKWRGDSEKLIRVLFELARYHQPSTIFVDEIDSIMSARTGSGEHEASRRMKTELLIQLDGLIKQSGERVFLLAASNLPWELDMALLRRLEKRILVQLPTTQAREGMLRNNLPPQRCEQDFNYGAYAAMLEGYSGSDIRLVSKEAAMKPLRRLMKAIEDEQDVDTINWGETADPQKIPGPGPIEADDMMAAINSTKSSAQAVPFQKYNKWMAEFGSV